MLTLNEFEKIGQHAEALETFLTEQVGETADWPVRINCDNPESALEMSCILNNLREALTPYREAYGYGKPKSGRSK